MTTRESFGRRLQTFRGEEGLSVDELGALILRNGKPLSGKTISAWEVGRGYPRPEEMPVLCEILHRPISAFYDEDLDRQEPQLTGPERRLIGLYRELDDYGRAKVYDYVDDLVASGNYERKNGPGAEVQAS